MGVKRMREWPVLLTATILPNPRAIGNVKDPQVRLTQYLGVLRHMVRYRREFERIVFCDNSGVDLTAVRDIGRWAADRGVQVEVHAVPMPDLSVFRGKGWGEGLIIKWALENVASLRCTQAFMKVTGRYMVRNLREVTSAIGTEAVSHPDLKFVCQTFTASPRPHMRTEFFWSDADFYRTHLMDAYQEVDDDQGVHLEHAMAGRLLRLCCQNRIGVAPMKVLVQGASGSSGKVKLTELDVVKAKLRQLLDGRLPLTILQREGSPGPRCSA
jgi:hypothetical protein